jgi:hypothetical protein
MSRPRVFRTMNVGGTRQRVGLYCNDDGGECVIDAKVCNIYPAKEYPQIFRDWVEMMEEFKALITESKETVSDERAIQDLDTFLREGYAHLLYMLRDNLSKRRT